MTPEKQVQTKILQYLADQKKSGEPLFFERRQAGGFSYKKGIPDIYFVYRHIHVEVEVKRPGGQLSTMQHKFRLQMERHHTPYACVDSIDDFKRFFETIKEFTF